MRRISGNHLIAGFRELLNIKEKILRILNPGIINLLFCVILTLIHSSTQIASLVIQAYPFLPFLDSSSQFLEHLVQLTLFHSLLIDFLED